MMSDAAKVLLGLSAAAAVTVGYVALKPAAASTTPAGGGGTVTLTPGRWLITGQLTPPYPDVMSWQQTLRQVVAGGSIVGITISGSGAVSATVDVAQTTTVNLAQLGSTFTAKLLSPQTAPTASGWVRATSLIEPGDAVRVSLDPTSFATILQSLPNLGSGKAAWIALLQQWGQSLTGTNPPQQIQAWAPGDPLPTDWPTDDPNVAQEYHAQFTYFGAVPLAVNTVPFPAVVWVKPGVGPINITLPPTTTPPTTTPAPVLRWTKVGRGNAMQPGQIVRMAIDPQTLGSTAAAYGILFSGVTALQTLMGAGFPTDKPWKATNLQVWAPGDATLPSDWPTDDPSPATEYHAQFTYGGPANNWTTSWQIPSGVVGATLWVGSQ